MRFWFASLLTLAFGSLTPEHRIMEKYISLPRDSVIRVGNVEIELILKTVGKLLHSIVDEGIVYFMPGSMVFSFTDPDGTLRSYTWSRVFADEELVSRGIRGDVIVDLVELSDVRLEIHYRDLASGPDFGYSVNLHDEEAIHYLLSMIDFVEDRILYKTEYLNNHFGIPNNRY